MEDLSSLQKHGRARTTLPIPRGLKPIYTPSTSSFTTRHAFAPAGYTTLSRTHPQRTVLFLSRWLTRSYATTKSAPASSKPTLPPKSTSRPVRPYKARAPAPKTSPKSSNASVNTPITSSAAPEPPQTPTEPLQAPTTEPSPPSVSSTGGTTGSTGGGSKTKITPRQLNAFVVNTLSAHREPPGVEASRRVVKEGPASLPAKYRPAARKITLVVVALPIAIVTSWVLYQRLVLGEERKRLVRDLPAPGETPAVTVTVREE